MGNRNNRVRQSDINNYGYLYEPYYNYEDIENYGSTYQPTGQEYPFSSGFTNEQFRTPLRLPRSRFGSFNQSGLGRYASTYPQGFNPMLEPRFAGPKIRVIFIPTGGAGAFPNYFQQGNINPSFGGLGGYVAPQMMPQMFYGSPMLPQVGQNFGSMLFPSPSMISQLPFPMPCPPPMIQPVMPSISMRKINFLQSVIYLGMCVLLKHIIT